MAAPVGNRFWELRSKHGVDALFDSPDEMWKAACEYFEWCEDNPLKEQDFRGKDAREVEINKMRPFTIQGLCGYLGCNVEYFRQFKDTVTYKEKDFARVVTRIEETIYNQKFTGAAIGFFNANIIARDLGLIDKKDLAVNGDITVEYIDGPNETED